MPFNPETKARMFTRCSRLCCLCLKQCGTNIEAAHILDESKGGSNDEGNGIPICFDCHTEIGHYSISHPKGNKFTPMELTERRDRVYKLVESGAMYAQIVAAQIRQTSSGVPRIDALGSTVEVKPSSDGVDVLKQGLRAPSEAFGRKLKILSERDRAYVLDGLVKNAKSDANAIKTLVGVLKSGNLTKDEAMLLLERLVRRLTLAGDTSSKAELLQHVPPELLAQTDEGLRLAFFSDALAIIDQDQFAEVNTIVAPLVAAQSAIPPSLYREYVLTLIRQEKSSSYHGAPAARQGLQNISDEMAVAAIDALDANYLAWKIGREPVRNLVERCQRLTKSRKKRRLFADFLSLEFREFFNKYTPSDDDPNF